MATVNFFDRAKARVRPVSNRQDTYAIILKVIPLPQATTYRVQEGVDAKGKPIYKAYSEPPTNIPSERIDRSSVTFATCDQYGNNVDTERTLTYKVSNKVFSDKLSVYNGLLANITVVPYELSATDVQKIVDRMVAEATLSADGIAPKGDALKAIKEQALTHKFGENVTNISIVETDKHTSFELRASRAVKMGYQAQRL